jgi:hypothetical protein
MQTQNTTENVLRFVQIRPPAPLDPGDGPVELQAETQFAHDLAAAGPSERRQLALRELTEERVARFLASDEVGRALEAVRAAYEKNGTVEDIASSLGVSEKKPTSEKKTASKKKSGSEKESASTYAEASDLMLAGKFASVAVPGLATVEVVFRALSANVGSASGMGGLTLDKYFRRPFALPKEFTRAPITAVGSPAGQPESAEAEPVDALEAPLGSTSGPSAGGPESAATESLDAFGEAVALALTSAEPVYGALEEIAALVHPAFLNLPSDGVGSSPSGRPFTLNDEGKKRLTDTATDVLDELGLDTATEAVDSIIQALEMALAAGVAVGVPPILAKSPPPSDPPEELPYLRDVGVADLLVVKQHLRRYERTDIAHIENVLIGETKSRTHRALERVEETITQERETIRERETELETAERFELNREMARTVQRDQEFGFSLSVSGKYGPSVEFTSNLQGSTSTSTEESVRSATRYAKDIAERSLERVVERVREEQVRRILREEEETNLHELENATNHHISGVYQFLEKVYESQVFNYGIREMFDFMVPEPASYLWYLEGSESELNLPTPPPRLDAYVSDATEITELLYPSLAAVFQAEGIEPPPPRFLITSAAVFHGQDAEGDAEVGKPRSVMNKDLDIPDGYRPYRALLRPLALTDDSLTLAITVGHTRRVWTPGSGQIDIDDEDHELGAESLDLSLLSESYLHENQGKLPMNVLAFETNSYSVAADVMFMRTDDEYKKWQLKTYDTLAAAYQDLVGRYDATVAELKAEAEAKAVDTTTRFGAPPSQNLKTIKAELKKHCISIVTRQRYEMFDVVQDGDPPYFDFDDAADKGSYTRFFEQAFEWDQMQYVFYPYFWSQAERWSPRFSRQDVDPAFLEFLQAGAARVVVPVRPGFEVALTHYLETLEIWNGEGEPPPINSPLYLPIITEIQERTDAPQGELPVGEPWPTRVPTPLAILRPNDDLPEWERPDPSQWEWEEVDTAAASSSSPASTPA